MKVIWTEPADEDLWHILAFIGERDPDAAWEMRDRFHAAADSLLQFPNRGRIGRVAGSRELVITPSYILVYVVGANCIRIMRLLHTAQDYPTAFYD